MSAKPGEPQKFFDEVVMTYEGDDCLIWPYCRTGKPRGGYGCIRVDGRMRPVHRIVCQMVHGAPPTPNHVAAHSCGKGQTGCVTKGHLSWKTVAGNNADKIVHGTSNRGERSPIAKLTEADVFAIRALKGQATNVEIGKRFGVNDRTISGIYHGHRWGWLDERRAG